MKTRATGLPRDELGFIEGLIDRALAEDVPAGDVTTRALIPRDRTGVAEIIAKSELVVAGVDVATAVFWRVDPTLAVDVLVPNATSVSPGTTILSVAGRVGSILVAERTALNFLQHTCGIATMTARFVAASAGHCRIADTRKTLPGLRALQRQAVRCGGGHNHRNDLSAGVLIKENHIACAGGVGPAIEAARLHAPHTMKIACEVRTLDELRQALDADVDVVLLDNMDDPTLADAIRINAGRATVEVSGGVTLERVPTLAALGVDVISVGSVTHSAPASDLSLLLRGVKIATGRDDVGRP